MKNEPSKEIDDLVYRIIGAALEVHRRLGPGFLESVYEEALCIELRIRNIPYERQVKIAVEYKTFALGEHRMDLIVKNLIIVELKTVEQLSAIHSAQIISYLKATNYHLGLLINFNVPVLKNGIKRFILS